MQIVIRQLSGFLVVGTVAFIIDWGLLTLSVEMLGLGIYWGRFLSISSAILVTWWGNRTYSFRMATPPHPKEFFQYLTTVLVSASINLSIYMAIILSWPMAQEQPLFALVPTTAVSMVVNFSLMRIWPFRSR